MAMHQVANQPSMESGSIKGCHDDPTSLIPATVLVIDSEAAAAGQLQQSLRGRGYMTLHATTDEDGLTLAMERKPEAIVVEINPPHVHALRFCTRYRMQETCTQIGIFVASKESPDDELLHLEYLASGADAVVSKPYNIPVLLARIDSSLRRLAQTGKDFRTLQWNGIRIDPRGRRAWADGCEIALTRSEYIILRNLVKAPGRVFERTEIIQALSGNDPFVSLRTVDVHMFALRKKLGPLGELLETVTGEGYRMRA